MRTEKRKKKHVCGNIYTNHGERHTVYFVFVPCLVLSERTVTLEKFVQHAAKGKPIGR